MRHPVRSLHVAYFKKISQIPLESLFVHINIMNEVKEHLILKYLKNWQIIFKYLLIIYWEERKNLLWTKLYFTKLDEKEK